MQSLQNVWFDLRYAAKGFVRSPAFAGIATVSLAIGIGINTAVFSIFNAVLLRPYPYPDADRIAIVYETNLKRGGQMTISPPDFLSWRENARTLQLTAAYRFWEPTLTGIEQAEQLTGLHVTGEFFALLGVQPVAGRALVAGDEASRNPVVVISEALWRRVYGTDPRVVGATIRLNGESYTVAGVMPPSLQLPHREIEVWGPLNLASERNDHDEHSVQVVARLAPGVGIGGARAELRALMAAHEAATNGDTAELSSLRAWFAGSSQQRTLWLLLGAVSLLLLTACANVANLLLARGSGRVRELTIRTAIGASRRRLLSQLIVESLTLAGIAGCLGALLAAWSVEGIGALMPSVSRSDMAALTFDWRVLGYTVVVSTAAGLIFGTLPAFRYSKVDLRPDRGSAVVTSFRLHGALLVAQAALAVTLLAGAGLLGRGFYSIWQIDPGFSSDGVTTARISLSGRQPNERKVAFFEDVVQQLSANPRVRTAGAVTWVPMIGGGSSNYVTIEGREALSEDPSTRPGAGRLIVTPGYFGALEIALRRGRQFGNGDIAGALPVVIINEAMARRYWGAEDPVGRRIKRGTPVAPFPWLTIVGVVADTQQSGLGGRPLPTIYLPLAQSAETAMTLVVKSDLPQVAVAALIRSTAREADPDQPVAWIRSLDEIVFGSVAWRWMPVVWMTLFAGAALLLATLGVYGVVSYAVEQRRREFGIRLALGAARPQLIRLALRQGLGPVAAGTVVGLGAAALLTRANAGFFVGAAPFDVGTYFAAGALLFVVALAASYVPVRRIANEDASLALRCE